MSKARQEKAIIPPQAYQAPQMRAPVNLAAVGAQSVVDETVTITEEGSMMTSRNDMSMPQLVRKKTTRKSKRDNYSSNLFQYEHDFINNPQFPSIGDFVKGIHQHPPFQEFFIPMQRKEFSQKASKNDSYWQGIFALDSDNIFGLPILQRFCQLKSKQQKNKNQLKQIHYGLSVYHNKFNMNDAKELMENYLKKYEEFKDPELLDYEPTTKKGKTYIDHLDEGMLPEPTMTPEEKANFE